MNGAENIIRRINEDNLLEIEKIKKDAEKEVAKIEENYRVKAEKILAEARDTAEKENEAINLRLRGQIKTQEKNIFLAAKNDMINQSFDMAEKIFSTQNRAKYLDFASKMLARCAALFGGKDFTVIMNKDDKKDFDKIFAAAQKIYGSNSGKTFSATLDEKDGDMLGGFSAICGDIEINCASNQIVESKKSELIGEVNAFLFG